MKLPTGTAAGSITAVVGAILAGGAGRRMGGGKPARLLRGRPLVSYPAAALFGLCERIVIVAKPDTALPDVPGVEVWHEPAEPRHPAAGIAYALECAGEPVLVCAADMPFVTPAACRQLIWAAPAVAVGADGRLQPLLGVYSPEARARLLTAARAGEPLTRAVESLAPARVELPALTLRSLDTPDALARAERELTQ
jgi:molybdopterin-guanine dinucleotide biosynthesis protein A